MSRLATAFIDIRPDTRKLSRGLRQAEGETKKRAGRISKLMNSAFSFAGGFGLAMGVKSTIATIADFEAALDEVAAVSGATAGEMKLLEHVARDLGKATQFSAAEAADAMVSFAQAGFSAREMAEALPAALDLAAAGSISIQESTDIAAKALRGMGMEAANTTQIADVFAKASISANTNVSQLGEAMKQLGPIGASSGRSLEELTAMVSLVSDGGIQASEAGTALRNVLLQVQSEGSTAAKAFKELGVETTDAEGKFLGIASIVDQVNDRFRGMTEEQRSTFTEMIAGRRSVAAFSVLLGRGGDDLRGFTQRLEEAGGTAERVAEEKMDNLRGSWLRFKSAVAETQLTVGESTGFLQTAVDGAADHVNKLGEELKLWTTDIKLAFDDLRNSLMLMAIDTFPQLEGFFEDVSVFAVGAFAGISTGWEIMLEAMRAALDTFLASFKVAWLEARTFAEDAFAVVTGQELDPAKVVADDAMKRQARGEAGAGSRKFVEAMTALPEAVKDAREAAAAQRAAFDDKGLRDQLLDERRLIDERIRAITARPAVGGGEGGGARRTPGGGGEGGGPGGGDDRSFAMIGLKEFASQIQRGLSPAEKMQKESLDVAKAQRDELAGQTAVLRDMSSNLARGVTARFA